MVKMRFIVPSEHFLSSLTGTIIIIGMLGKNFQFKKSTHFCSNLMKAGIFLKVNAKMSA